MTTGVARPSVSAPAEDRTRSASRAVTAFAVRQLRGGTVVVALTAGVLPALVAVQYRATVPVLDVPSLVALARNPAIRTLFGPPVALDDPGGFTIWRTGTVLAVLVGTWALLSATRLTRGQEDAGRWDLLLAGSITLPGVVARHLVVLLYACLLIGGSVSTGLLVGGTAVHGALLFGAGVAGIGMAGAALGALAAQLFPDRRGASGAAIAVLAAAVLLHMVADGVTSLAWAQWLTPFGLVGRTAPFSADDPLPLLVLTGGVAGTAAMTGLVAGRRDVQGGPVHRTERNREPSRLLGSASGFAVHRARPPALGWSAGIAAYCLLIGVLATSLTEFLVRNPRFAELAARAGVVGLDTVEGFTAALSTLLAVPLGAFAAGRLAATSADESAGRLALVFSLPVSRTRWLATGVAVVSAGCVLLAGVAALAGWLGDRAVGAPLALGAAVGGALNVVPVALLCLGAAVFALGWQPRVVLVAGLLPAVGGYLLLVLTDTLRWPSWVRWLSPFDHIAAVPVERVDRPGAVGLLTVAVLLAVVGAAGYRRRDLRG